MLGADVETTSFGYVRRHVQGVVLPPIDAPVVSGGTTRGHFETRRDETARS